MFAPVISDINAARNPDIVVTSNVVNKPSHSCRTPGVTCDAAMQTNGHHARPFRVQYIEGILQVIEELLSRVKALGRRETHIVGVECIGHH